MTTEQPIDAVGLMREIRAKLDREYEGLSLEQRVERMRARIAQSPEIRRWVERAGSRTSSP